MKARLLPRQVKSVRFTRPFEYGFGESLTLTQLNALALSNCARLHHRTPQEVHRDPGLSKKARFRCISHSNCAWFALNVQHSHS
jgi:hypothetical protein